MGSAAAVCIAAAGVVALIVASAGSSHPASKKDKVSGAYKTAAAELTEMPVPAGFTNCQSAPTEPTTFRCWNSTGSPAAVARRLATKLTGQGYQAKGKCADIGGGIPECYYRAPFHGVVLHILISQKEASQAQLGLSLFPVPVPAVINS